MTDKRNDTGGLETHFEAARRHRAEPSDALLARVLADAQTVQDELSVPAPASRARQRGAPMNVFRILGGWPALTGLGTAAMAGVWLGVYPPEGLAATAQSVIGGDQAVYLIDLAPEMAFDLDEGAS